MDASGSWATTGPGNLDALRQRDADNHAAALPRGSERHEGRGLKEVASLVANRLSPASAAVTHTAGRAVRKALRSGQKGVHGRSPDPEAVGAFERGPDGWTAAGSTR